MKLVDRNSVQLLVDTVIEASTQPLILPWTQLGTAYQFAVTNVEGLPSILRDSAFNGLKELVNTRIDFVYASYVVAMRVMKRPNQVFSLTDDEIASYWGYAKFSSKELNSDGSRGQIKVYLPVGARLVVTGPYFDAVPDVQAN